MTHADTSKPELTPTPGIRIVKLDTSYLYDEVPEAEIHSRGLAARILERLEHLNPRRV